jgi:hypothetical protein
MYMLPKQRISRPQTRRFIVIRMAAFSGGQDGEENHQKHDGNNDQALPAASENPCEAHGDEKDGIDRS